MWTLFVISMVYATETQMEAKITRYKAYSSQWDCNNALEELEKEFKMGETAMCYQTSRPEPSPNIIY